jgi:hypothetical protein
VRKAALGQESASDDRLSMTPAIACEKISGYDEYVPLKEAALTKDEKLLVYYVPLHYRVQKDRGKFRMHFRQEARIRKRGEKKALWSNDHFAEEEREGPVPPNRFYLMNKLTLKDFPPGDYDLDIILHDVLLEKELGRQAPAQQVLRFTVKPSPSEEADATPEPKKTAKPKPSPRRRR